MTDTTTLDESSEELPELVESESLGSDAAADDNPLKQRMLLPFLLPLLSILIVAVLVLNISRVFLAGCSSRASTQRCELCASRVFRDCPSVR